MTAETHARMENFIWSICNIARGDTFTKDGCARDRDGKKWTFDYLLANPPFGVGWKRQQTLEYSVAESAFLKAAEAGAVYGGKNTDRHRPPRTGMER